EPACWRGFIGMGGVVVRLKPDLYARVGAGSVSEDRWMIEGDRATEASGTIRTKAKRHLAYWTTRAQQLHPRVLWVVPDARRAGQIVDVLRPLQDPAARLFAVCLADEAIDFIAEEARS